MDDTGSTTFVLFDRQVTQFIGRTVEDLIKEHDKVLDRSMYYIWAFVFHVILNSHLLIFRQGGASDYPTDFDVLLDKQILFKVEVGEGNIMKKYRNYTVKKASDDVGVIEQFMSKYNLEVVHNWYYNLIIFLN
jgi:hypothetical protein